MFPKVFHIVTIFDVFGSFVLILFYDETLLAVFSIVVDCRIDYNLNNNNEQDCEKRQGREGERFIHGFVPEQESSDMKRRNGL